MSVNISVDKATLITKISISPPNEKVWRGIWLTITSTSDEISIDEDSLLIQWSTLIKYISRISYIIKREKETITFSQYSKLLINQYIDDKKKFHNVPEDLLISSEEIESILKEKGFTRTLTKNQLNNLRILYSLKHGANFSVPGAGKTTTMLALNTLLKEKGLINKLFVISPVNAFLSWEEEIIEIFKVDYKKVLRLTVDHVRNPRYLLNNDCDIYLVNYEKLRGEIEGLIPIFNSNHFHLILDESHRIKSGFNNMAYNQIIRISNLAPRRDIMTGTPLPQSPIDLVPQFYYLWKIDISRSATNANDVNLQIDHINRELKSKFVRTTKSQLGLKQPIITIHKIEMGPIQLELYELFTSELNRRISGLTGDDKTKFRNIGKCVVQLLQAATNPMLLASESEYFEEVIPKPLSREVWELLSEYTKYEKSTKIEFLLSRVEAIISENESNKVIVWTYFVKNIQLLENLLNSYNPVSIYGSIPTGDSDDLRYREARIKKFHEDPTCRVLIGNPQACGEGISLHKACHHAIYLDRNFNAAYFLQSIDRIHRLGLARDVNTSIEIITARNSIDEVVHDRLNDKTRVMGEVLDDKGLVKFAYDPLDIPKEDHFGLDFKDYRSIKDFLKRKTADE